MVDTLEHYNCGFNVVFETLELDISLVPSSTGSHGRPAGGHRGQFPHTDFGAVTESSPLTTLPGPMKLRLFGASI